MSNFQRGNQGGRATFNSNSKNNVNDSFNRGMPCMNPWDISPNIGSNINFGGNNNMGASNNFCGNSNVASSNNFGGNMMNRPSGGLLPTPNMPAMGLLETPNMQSAQLAKMLSLLQNQQTSQMPSLLGPSPNGLLPLSPPPMNPFNKQNFRGQGLPSHQDNLGPNRAARSNNLSRRPEPYNKIGNRNQRPGQKNDDRKTSNVSPRVRGPGLSPKNDVLHTRNTREERKTQKSDLKLTEKQEQEKIKTEFSEIPVNLLHCHVCNKKVGDCISFMNHVKSKAHLSMMDRQEEQYKAHTEKLRQQMRVEEQQRQISLAQSRHGKPSQPNEYCTMCNLKFNGNLTQHRKGPKHQQLKAFLHPRCNICDKEFPTRLDYDHHLLSVGHFKTLASKPPNQEDAKKSSQKVDNKLAKPETLMKKPPDNRTSPVATVSVSEEKNNKVLPKPVESEKEELPVYNPQTEIGTNMLKEITGFLCQCCNRFLSSSFDAQNHTKSKHHYDKFIEHLKAQQTKSPKQNGNQKSPCNKTKTKAGDMKADEKLDLTKPENGVDPNLPENNKVDTIRVEEDEKKDATEEGKKDVAELEEEEDDDEDESNWKRRKISKDDDLSMDTTLTLNQEPPTNVVTGQEQDTLKDASDKSEDGPADSPDINEDLEETLLLEENPISSVSA